MVADELADRRAEIIRAYWRERGYGDVHVWTVRVGLEGVGRRAAWGLRSNLVDGMPPGMGGRWAPPSIGPLATRRRPR